MYKLPHETSIPTEKMTTVQAPKQQAIQMHCSWYNLKTFALFQFCAETQHIPCKNMQRRLDSLLLTPILVERH